MKLKPIDAIIVYVLAIIVVLALVVAIYGCEKKSVTPEVAPEAWFEGTRWYVLFFITYDYGGGNLFSYELRHTYEFRGRELDYTFSANLLPDRELVDSYESTWPWKVYNILEVESGTEYGIQVHNTEINYTWISYYRIDNDGKKYKWLNEAWREATVTEL